jgi:hypothetical protein
MKRAILPQSDVGKAKVGIRDYFNSYRVMIGRQTPQPVRLRGTQKAFCYKVNDTCT